MANHEIFKDLTADQTTPQGTQQNAVVYGHDDRDVFVGSVIRWLVGVGIGTAIIIGILAVLFGVMKRGYEANDRIPSPLFVENQIPPRPRIEGFTIFDDEGKSAEMRDVTPDRIEGFTIYGKDGKPIKFRDGTPEHLAAVRGYEENTLKKFGLGKVDEHNQSTNITPQMALNLADKIPAAKSAPADEKSAGLMSDASGGTLIDPHR